MKTYAVLAALLALGLGAAWWVWDGGLIQDPAPPPPLDASAMPAELARLRPDQLVLGRLELLYAGFGETSEGAIYDRLAAAADTQVTEQLYLQKRASLTSGLDPASQTLHAIELQDLRAEWDGWTLNADARWGVIATLGHGSHQHVRGNSYAAVLKISPIGGDWRLTAFELTAIEREDAGQVIAQPKAQEEAR